MNAHDMVEDIFVGLSIPRGILAKYIQMTRKADE